MDRQHALELIARMRRQRDHCNASKDALIADWQRGRAVGFHAAAHMIYNDLQLEKRSARLRAVPSLHTRSFR